MTPADFIAKWGPGGPAYALNEEQGAQSYFLDLCELLGVPKPGSGEVADEYLFERSSLVLGEARGYADVFYRDHFAWENKAPGKNLDAALRQLQQYSLALANPPLLVVCDRLTIRIHTQFNGHPSQTHTVRLDQLDQPEARELLRRLWTAPESFRPQLTNRAITEAAAQRFATLAEQLRRRGHHPDAVAHFLTQCLFCFFAEDVGLLPGRMFERLVGNRHLSSERLTQGLQQLFATMRDGGLYGPDDLPWFNGGLFARIEVPRLEVPDVTELRKAAALNWSAIDVSIFGTLFERGLDPAKRSQLGAHYTDPATIARIIDPVITRPLLQQWERFAQELRALTAKIKKHGDAAYQKAHARFVEWLQTLADFRILDPACGSGNFLFLGLKALKDVELFCITQAADLGLAREQDLVTGAHNVLGIELNEYAAELARVSIWIGEIQWRIAHGYQPKTNPVLEPLEQIECRDALLDWPTAGPQGTAPREATWPRADVVVGNPPFLGGSKKRRELGPAYFDALNAVYAHRVPGAADLVCYWFDKARAAIASGQLQRAGLVATNSIRGGKNRVVLDAIVRDSRIYEAWSDEPWVNEGAAVRVSIVCFGASEQAARLDGQEVFGIHADLTRSRTDGTGVDLTKAQPLVEAGATCFMGASKKAPFDIDGALARQWLRLPNPNGRSNAEVLRPLCNGIDITRRWGDRWIVDFGTEMTLAEAALFEAPFAYVEQVVKPLREKNNREAYRKFWWRHAEPRPGMRAALVPLPRYIVTAAVAKYRSFIWMHHAVLADQATLAIARADDTTFGILHSRFHEVWSLRMGTSLEDRPRYTPTTCFETFPFPAGLTPADTAHQRTEAVQGGALIPAGLADTVVIAAPEFEPNQPQAKAQQSQAAPKSITLRAAATAIAQAAQRLDALRQAWLNPPEWTQRVPEVVPLGTAQSPYPERIVPRPGFEKELQQRTLTKLYNQRPAWLVQAHAELDAAVAAAYGWADYTPDWSDEDILRRLLALNQVRSRA